jgi:hypothetical protein
MKVSEYKTVTSGQTDNLDVAINASIKQGFQLYGPPYIIFDGKVICQPMVKLADPEPAEQAIPRMAE